MNRIEKIAHDTPGVEHTVGITGQSLILNANAPNLGSMYVMLKSFDQRHSASLSADAIGADLQERCRRESLDATVTVFGAPPVDGLGSTSGFRMVIEDRGNAGLGSTAARVRANCCARQSNGGAHESFQQLGREYAVAVSRYRSNEVRNAR